MKTDRRTFSSVNDPVFTKTPGRTSPTSTSKPSNYRKQYTVVPLSLFPAPTTTSYTVPHPPYHCIFSGTRTGSLKSSSVCGTSFFSQFLNYFNFPKTTAGRETKTPMSKTVLTYNDYDQGRILKETIDYMMSY